MMKRLFLLLFIGGFMVGQLPSPEVFASANLRNVDVPVLSTMLEQRDGSRIKLSFRAVHWDASGFTEMMSDPVKRDYYNQNILSKMGLLDTNVNLRFGPSMHLQPGRYFLGIQVNPMSPADKKLNMSLVITDGQTPLINLPMNVVQSQNQVEHLAFTFTPGITDRDFMFNWMYGNLFASVRWTITGIPARTLAELKNNRPSLSDAWQLPLPEGQNVSKSMLPSSTPSLSDQSAIPTRPSQQAPGQTPKKKAGSGSLRYLKEIQDQKNANQKKEENDDHS